MKFWLIVPAAGIGARMQAGRPKQYLQVAGKSILEHTLAVFLNHPQLQRIVLPLSADDDGWPQTALAQDARILPVIGGAERADSVLAGLRALPALGAAADDWVLVHDAARPLLQADDLQLLLDSLQDDPVGGLLACQARDTLKLADSHGRSQSTLPREQIWHALTPQMFRLQPLQAALSAALAQGIAITDEASVMEWAGHAPRLVAGRSDNIKVTRPEDLALLDALRGTGQFHA
ncbi:MAG: 2-C-methyl-D-erythritol 4-phosphate cytidylyltransferase [Gammaproteobacteria bacterium]|nr:2-C-methyl-D-erythritol 4-phosphate cytidylyltransferase [Gammaproteobacteria bacterium]